MKSEDSFEDMKHVSSSWKVEPSFFIAVEEEGGERGLLQECVRTGRDAAKREHTR